MARSASVVQSVKRSTLKLRLRSSSQGCEVETHVRPQDGYGACLRVSLPLSLYLPHPHQKKKKAVKYLWVRVS